MLLQQCTFKTGHGSEIIYPNESWAISTPEAEGLDAAVLDAIHTDITNGKYGLIDEFLVIRHGKIVADHHYTQNYDSIAVQYDTTNWMFNYDHPEWHPYYQRSRLHSLQSVTKSVTSVALGIAMDEGRIGGVDIHPMELFTSYEQDFTDPRRKAITLADMLTMRSGIDWNEGSYTNDDNSCIIMEKSNA
jgi:hypothetical protein